MQKTMRKIRRRSSRTEQHVTSMADVLVQRSLQKTRLCLSLLKKNNQIPKPILHLLSECRFCKEPAWDCCRDPCRVRQQISTTCRSHMRAEESLLENINLLADRLGLTSTERDVFSAVAMTQSHKPLSTLFSFLCSNETQDTIPLIARMVDREESDIRDVLQPDATLMRTGVIQLWPVENGMP